MPCAEAGWLQSSVLLNHRIGTELFYYKRRSGDGPGAGDAGGGSGRRTGCRHESDSFKATNDTGSQVIINGKPIGVMSASEYYRHKKEYIPYIMDAYEELARKYDVIVIEGAGSPAEINLKKDDIVNMGLAELVDAPVLLAGGY